MSKKALFLDRDGIVNVDYGYVHTIDKFEFHEDIFELVSLFSDAGYLVFIVTNQSGIARGYYTKEEFENLTIWMVEQFLDKNIVIEMVEHCPHLPIDNCICRKPKTGMIDAILDFYDVDLDNSWMIGDKQSDMDLAISVNIYNSIGVGSSKIINSSYKFDTISETYNYLKQNKDKIL